MMETVSHGPWQGCGREAFGRDITLNEGRNSPRSVGLSYLSNKQRSKCPKLDLKQNGEKSSFKKHGLTTEK